jgi:hypothetical protein
LAAISSRQCVASARTLSLPNWLVSTGGSKIKLNRWNNGLVIVEMLPPVDTSQFGKDNVRALAAVAAFPVLLLAGRFALGHFVVQLSDFGGHQLAAMRVLLAGNEFPFSFVSMSWS